MPTRRHTVVQSSDQVLLLAQEAMQHGTMTVDLRTEDGATFPIAFQLRTMDRDDDGSFLLVGVSDLDVLVNIQVDAAGVYANLQSP